MHILQLLVQAFLTADAHADRHIVSIGLKIQMDLMGADGLSVKIHRLPPEQAGNDLHSLCHAGAGFLKRDAHLLLDPAAVAGADRQPEPAF